MRSFKPSTTIHPFATRAFALTILSAAAASCGGGSGGPSMPVNDILAPPSDGFQLAMAPFTVQPGGEAYMCQGFQLPVTSESDVAAWEFKMSQGSHHLAIFKVSQPSFTDGPGPCDGVAGPPNVTGIVTGTQQPSLTVTFPSGVGYLIEPGEWVVMQAHYLNAGDQPLTADVAVNAHLANPSTITSHAGTYFFSPFNMSIPPGPSQSLTFQCQAPQDMNLLFASGHMHKHGLTFDAQLQKSGGGSTVPVFHADTWNNPAPATFDPPLAVSASDTFQWTCTWNNDTGSTLTFGPSATANEMCILYGTFYPVTSTDTLFCVPN